MKLADLLSALRRRWPIVAAGLLLTVGLGLLTSQFIRPTYTATTSMLLLPPKSTVGARGNLYLNLLGLNPAMDVLRARILADDRTRSLVDSHPNASITLGPDTTTAGPILLIGVSAESEEESISIRDQLVAEVPPSLSGMQKELSIPGQSQITVTTLAVDPKPEVSHKDQLRAVIAVVGSGAAATLVLTGLLDGALQRRAEGRRAAGSSTPRRAGRRLDPDASSPPDEQWRVSDGRQEPAQPTSAPVRVVAHRESPNRVVKTSGTRVAGTRASDVEVAAPAATARARRHVNGSPS
ncbi:hypothetical protein [Microlunatus ginsengisoli]|uniref:Capsular polysaccharide biosynthesis protein n=1 Tax=Microlunatus ginsengisoli TaxID=363863 RepID=A0ABP7AHC1_9ACTN